MGLVYQVKQIFINKEFALKTIDKHSLSEIAIRRFQQEARTTFAVDHPNIVAVQDFGVLDDQTPFLVMELINGETLADRLKRVGCLPIEQAIAIFVQICFGLAYAHERGIVHRDIKPSNIMLLSGLPVGTEGSVKILDFGIAKFAGHEGGEVQALTRTGEIFGSPLYMSPEQCSGLQIDSRADIYALGCVLFEALTGTPPFIADNALTTMIKHQSEAPPTLKQASLGAEFPKDLQEIVSRMLAKSPAQRYQNLGDVAHDLGAVHRGDSILQPVVPIESEEKTISMKHSTFALLTASMLLAPVASGCLGYILHPDTIRVEKVEPKSPFAFAALAVPSTEIDEELRAELLQKMLDRPHHKTGRFVVNYSILKARSFKLISEAGWIHDLDFGTGTIENDSLDLLAKLGLNRIDLTRTNFDDQGAAKLAKCTSLVEIYAHQTSLGDEGLSKLAELNNLKSLQLASTPNITNQGLKVLTKTHVDNLDLSEDKIDDGGMVYLSQMDKLARVDLCKTKITPAGLKELLKNRSLKVILVVDCPNIHDSDLQTLLVSHPGITFVAHEGPKVNKDFLH